MDIFYEYQVRVMYTIQLSLTDYVNVRDVIRTLYKTAIAGVAVILVLNYSGVTKGIINWIREKLVSGRYQNLL